MADELETLVETHHEPGTIALADPRPEAIKEPEADGKIPAAPGLPEGFSQEKWEKLNNLEKEFENIRPILEKRGLLGLQDVADLLDRDEEIEEVEEADSSPAPAATPDEFWNGLKPGEQTWVNNFKKHLASDPAFKDLGGIKNIRANVSDAIFNGWMLQMQLEHLTQALSGVQGLNVPKLEASPKEIRKVLETFGKTLIPRALRAGKNPASEGYAYILSQKSAQKPFSESSGQTGIDKGLRTEKPGGVPTGTGKPPFPMLSDGSDFDWDKMDSDTMYKALGYLAKLREQQGR